MSWTPIYGQPERPGRPELPKGPCSSLFNSSTFAENIEVTIMFLLMVEGKKNLPFVGEVWFSSYRSVFVHKCM